MHRVFLNYTMNEMDKKDDIVAARPHSKQAIISISRLVNFLSLITIKALTWDDLWILIILFISNNLYRCGLY